MKNKHILIIALVAALLLSFNIFITAKFYSLRSRLEGQGIVYADRVWGGFDAEAEMRTNEKLFRAININANAIAETNNRIYDLENHLNIERGYIKKEKP